MILQVLPIKKYMKNLTNKCNHLSKHYFLKIRTPFGEFTRYKEANPNQKNLNKKVIYSHKKNVLRRSMNSLTCLVKKTIIMKVLLANLFLKNKQLLFRVMIKKILKKALKKVWLNRKKWMMHFQIYRLLKLKILKKLILW